MRITVLAENTSCRADIGQEHGLSLFIETGDKKLLFDFGQTGLFAENARALGVDLSSVELGFLSHGHYDHGGGLGEFLGINPKAPVYLSRYAFGGHYNALDKYIGLDGALEGCSRLCFCDGVTPVAPGITLYGGKSPALLGTLGSRGMKLKTENGLCPDPFDHEQYLVIEEGGKRFLFSGCSHRGAWEICRYFSPDYFIGGFHFSKTDPQTKEGRALLTAEGEKLSREDTVYYTCHCTGQAQFEFLKGKLGERLFYLSSGMTVSI